MSIVPACEQLYSDLSAAMLEVNRNARPEFSSGDMATAIEVGFQYRAKLHQCLAERRIIPRRCQNQLDRLSHEGTSFTLESQTSCRFKVLEYVDIERSEMEGKTELNQHRWMIIAQLVGSHKNCGRDSFECVPLRNRLTKIIATHYSTLKSDSENTPQFAMNAIWRRYIDPLLYARSTNARRPTDLACGVVESLKQNHAIDVMDPELLTSPKWLQKIGSCDGVVDK